MSTFARRTDLLTRYAVVRMESTHLGEVLAIERESQPSPWSKDAFVHEIAKNSLSRQRVVVTVAQPTEVAAYAVTWLVFERLHIQNLAVRPGHRRQGLAKLLLRGAIEEAVQHGAAFALLEVRRSNAAARGLYRSLGFEAFGQRRDYYTCPVEDALLYRKDLVS